MTRRQLNMVNAGAAIVVLALSIGTGVAFDSNEPERRPASFTAGLVDLPASACANKVAPCRGLFDAVGTPVPVGHFTRIASGNIVADGLLLALAEPERIAAFSPYAHELANNHRFTGRPSLSALEDIEGLLGLHPDLFVISSMSDRAHMRRLREAGIAVFDLGAMEGLATLRTNITTMAQLLGTPQRGIDLIKSVDHRLDALARAPRSAWRALYVGIHGDKMYGGTVGSSLHDVIVAAGLKDAAAEKFRGWPPYTHEDLLGLDPDVILTQSGMAGRLCHHPGLEQLAACKKPIRFIELPSAQLTDPGLAVIDAAEAVASTLRTWNPPPLASP